MNDSDEPHDQKRNYQSRKACCSHEQQSTVFSEAVILEGLCEQAHINGFPILTASRDFCWSLPMNDIFK
jgi:hypothetical protein